MWAGSLAGIPEIQSRNLPATSAFG